MNICFGYRFTAHKSSRFEHVALLYVGPGSIRKGPYVKERKTERFRHLHTWYLLHAEGSIILVYRLVWYNWGHTITSLQLLLDDHIVQQSMFDEYDVVHIVVRVRMSVITTTDARISLSLARSLARRRSCYYYDPWSYSVLKWWIQYLVHVWWEYSYTWYIS